MLYGAAYGANFPGAFWLYNQFINPEGPLDCGHSDFRAYGSYGDPLRRGYSTFVDSSDYGCFTPSEIEVFAVAVPLC